MHLQSSTVTIVFLSTLSVLSLSSFGSVVEAHSWADCIDWKPKDPENPRWSDKDGHCEGYARRFPLNHAFGTLDSASPSRHYQQDHKNPDKAPPCSNGHWGKDKGSDETLADPPSDAYGGKYGQMTLTQVGATLCVRWPAKNHAESNEDDTEVQINLSKNVNGKDPSQQELLKNTIKLLPYKECDEASTTDKRPCGGCFEVPVRASGRYLLQWRWMLNPGEWYTSCADIEIGAGTRAGQSKSDDDRKSDDEEENEDENQDD
ncbi:hypothetical protein EDD11_006256 [Mortierella claussenii]|nr:hypothetical protein EDD11_006256 [Mortierella claussenii]